MTAKALSLWAVMGIACDCGRVHWAEELPCEMAAEQRAFYDCVKQEGWQVRNLEKCPDWDKTWEADDDGLWWGKCPECQTAREKA